MGGRRAKILAGAALLCLAVPAAVSARPSAVPSVTWSAPTPAEGARLNAVVGTQLDVGLAASAPGGAIANVTIEATGLPPGATFRHSPGNPASASVHWIPPEATAGQVFAVTFTARSSTPAVPAAVRHITLSAYRPGQPPPWAPPAPPKPKPKPKPRPKPERFVLSSTKKELFRWAFVIRPTVVRSAPRSTAGVVARLGRWTPEGTSNLVLTLDGRRTKRGVWIRVRLPILPANRTGWVKRKTLSDWKEVRTRLVVDRRRLTATLFRRGKVVFRAPVGVGESRWPTPRGEFFIRNQLYGFGNPVYGPIAFGTSARSAVLTDWPGGGFIGIHGTNQPHLLPGRVSHGCIRMKNGHILRLARLMPVGTPLSVL